MSNLPNTAGEPEPEALSRRHNLVEGVGVMVAILVALWWIAYPFGVLMGCGAANALSRLILGGLFLFTMFVSPWLHGDTASSRGLGHPRWVWRALTSGPVPRRFGFCVLIGILTLSLAIILHHSAAAIGRILFAIPRDVVLAAQEGDVGRALSLTASLLCSALCTVCILRYDNFLSALAIAVKMLAILVPGIMALALAINGPATLLSLDWRLEGSQALGYVFWGAIQQILFCGYFGTRLRKGFAPDPARRWRSRLLVAILNGSFFGLIHINSWTLVAATWLLGTFLSWAFMEDRGRNLFALGIVHGVLGTCTGALFGQGSGLHIRMRVGPWWMPDQPDLLTLGIASLLIIALSALALSAVTRRSP